MQPVFFFRHDDFDNVELYCVTRWAKVIMEGAEEHIFDISNKGTPGATAGANNTPVEEEGTPISTGILHSQNRPEDIVAVRNQGLDVDCDDEPAPENIPDDADAEQQHGQSWGWAGQCHRATSGAQNHRPSIVGIHGITLEVITLVRMFLIFSPAKIWKTFFSNKLVMLLEEILYYLVNCCVTLEFGYFLSSHLQGK